MPTAKKLEIAIDLFKLSGKDERFIQQNFYVFENITFC